MNEVRQSDEFKAWMRELDGTTRALVAARIIRLEAGNFGDTKPLGGKVNELRIDYGPGYRVYYTRRGRQLYLLLCGGDKKSQDNDIKRARRMVAQLD